MRQSEFSDWQNNMAGLRSWFAIMCVILMAEEMRACQLEFRNLNASIVIESSHPKGEAVYILTTKSPYLITSAIKLSAESKYFELDRVYNRKVVTKSCLPAGHVETLEFSLFGDYCGDHGNLTITISPVSPVFNNPTTVVVHAMNGDFNELDVFDIAITNTGICTYFVCDVVCLNDGKLFWIDKGGTFIHTKEEGLRHKYKYELLVTCLDKSANYPIQISSLNSMEVDVTFIGQTISKEDTVTEVGQAYGELQMPILRDGTDMTNTDDEYSPDERSGLVAEMDLLGGDHNGTLASMKRHRRSVTSTSSPGSSIYTTIRATTRCFCNSNFPRLGANGFYIRKCRQPIVIVPPPTTTTTSTTTTTTTTIMTTTFPSTSSTTEEPTPSTSTTPDSTSTTEAHTSTTSTIPDSTSTTEASTSTTTMADSTSTTEQISTSTTADSTSTTEASTSTTTETSTDSTSTTEASTSTTTETSTDSTSTTEIPTSTTTETSTDSTSTTQESTTATTTKTSTDSISTTEEPTPTTTKTSTDSISTTEEPTPTTTKTSTDLISTTEEPTPITTKTSTDSISTTEEPTPTTRKTSTDSISTTEALTSTTTKTSTDSTSTIQETTTATTHLSSELASTTPQPTSATTKGSTDSTGTTPCAPLPLPQATATPAITPISSGTDSTTDPPAAPTNTGALVDPGDGDDGFFDDTTNLISVVSVAGVACISGIGVVLYKAVIAGMCRSSSIGTGSTTLDDNILGDYQPETISATPDLVANTGTNDVAPLTPVAS